MKNIFLWIFLFTIGIYACKSAVTEGYCRRVKRSKPMGNTTKIIGNNLTATSAATTERNKNLSTIITTKPKREDEIATQIRSAIEKLKTPTSVHARHVRLNRTELRRNIDKEHYGDVRHQKSLLLFNPHTNDESFDNERKDEKFFEFLTGKSNGGETKYHHDRYGRAYFVKDNSGKKLKRQAVKSTIHHKLHKDNKDHKHKRSETESPMDNFMRLTKMLVKMSGNMRPDSSLYGHNTDAEALAPMSSEHLTEVIYKPIGVDSTNRDDVALITSNEPQSQHAILPIEGAGYHEFTLPLLPNFSPLKFHTNAVEAAGKEDCDNDEYEMTCPVHFKRSTDGVGSKDGNAGVVELCTCHLYRKKKQVL